MNYDEVVQYTKKIASILGINYSVSNITDYEVSFEKSNVKFVCSVNPIIPRKHIEYKIKVTAFQVLERLVEIETKGI